MKRTTIPLSLALAAVVATPLQAEWLELDTFEDGVAEDSWNWVFRDAPGRYDPNDPPTLEVIDDPAGINGKVLKFDPGAPPPETWGNAYITRILTGNEIVQDNFEKATIYFQTYRPLVQGAPPQHNAGMYIFAWPTDNDGNRLPEFLAKTQDGYNQSLLNTPDASVVVLIRPENGYFVHDDGFVAMMEEGGEPATLPSSTWFHTWLVLDHSNNTFDVYAEIPGFHTEPTLIYDDANYRKDTFAPLEVIYMWVTMSHPDTLDEAHLDPILWDNFFIDTTGENLSYPSGGSLPAWHGYPLNAAGWANTGSWLGQLNAAHDPYIWSQRLGKFIHVIDDSGWIHIHKD
jgi:hypothetical protein